MRVATAILLLLFLAVPRARACEELVGRWEGEKRPRGIGQTFDFQNNGVFFIIVGAMMDGTYTVDTGSLTLTYPDPMNPETSVTTRFAMILSGDRMELNDATRPDKVVMTRVGAASPSSPPYVGMWASVRPDGNLTTTRLEPDGTMVYRVPVSTVKGRYVCANGEVSLELPKVAQKRRYHVDGSTLTFEKTEKSDEKVYHRAE